MLKVRSPILDMLCMILAQAQTGSAAPGPGGGIGSFFVPLIFIILIIYFVVSRRQKQTAQAARKRGAGTFLIVLGLAIAGYFFFLFDTSVEAESYISGYGKIGGGRVVNLARMQDRTLGCIGGIAMAVVGAIMAVAEKKS